MVVRFVWIIFFSSSFSVNVSKIKIIYMNYINRSIVRWIDPIDRLINRHEPNVWVGECLLLHLLPNMYWILAFYLQFLMFYMQKVIPFQSKFQKLPAFMQNKERTKEPNIWNNSIEHKCNKWVYCKLTKREA